MGNANGANSWQSWKGMREGMAWEATESQVEDVTCWTLAGPGGVSCRILPGHGSQLSSLRLVPAPGQEPLELLEDLPPPRLNHASWQHGTPILFPFPGRLRDGAFQYRERTYQVPTSGRHPMHGLVGLVPWRVRGAGASAEGAWLDTVITHAESGAPEDSLPGPYEVQVVHRLGPEGYGHEITVRNVGPQPIPFGYGWHPHFRIPLGPGGARGECTLQLAAHARWELTAELLPTGRRLAAAGPYDLRTPNPLGDKSYDDPFTLLERDARGGSCVVLADPQHGRRLEVWAGPGFEHWVLYAPRKAETIAIEPYTCIPDALNLEPRGIPTGLRELAPGAEWRGVITVRLTEEGART